MRLVALVLTGLLTAAASGASTASAAKKPAPYASETTDTVRALRDRQRTTAVTVLGAMRAVRRVAEATGTNHSLPIGGGLMIQTAGLSGGKFAVSLLSPNASGSIVGTTGGRLPQNGHATIGQNILRVAPRLTTEMVDGAVATFLTKAAAN